jgi:hypothetical protein
VDGYPWDRAPTAMWGPVVLRLARRRARATEGGG